MILDNIKELANFLKGFSTTEFGENEDIGEVPGHINVKDLKFPPPNISLIEYNKDSFVQKTLSELPRKEELTKAENVSWLIVEGFGQEEFISQLKERLGIHKLQIEDITDPLHPPKLESFDDSIFLLLRLLLSDDESGDSPISIVLYDNSLILFSPDGKFNHVSKIIERIKLQKGIVHKRGADYLLFTLLDIVIDTYFPQLNIISNTVKEIDREIFEEKNTLLLHELKIIRQVLNIYFDNLIPLKNILNRLLRTDFVVVQPEHVKYFNDVSDQTSFLCERINRLKEATLDIMNLSISINGQKMNEVMKILTIISSLFIPLSFIAGIYGMNFDPSKSPFNMPELSWFYGYPFALGLMATVATGMTFFFLKKKWL